MRGPVLCGVILILLVVSAYPVAVQAVEKMAFGAVGLASQWTGCGELLCQQSLNVTVSGSVVDENDRSPITDAAISIQAQLWFWERNGSYPSVSYGNTTATTFTNAAGRYESTLQFPFPYPYPDSTALCTGTEWFPAFSINMVADKAGYEPASATVNPSDTLPFGDIPITVASPSKLTIARGETGSLNVSFYTFPIDRSRQTEPSENWTAFHVPAGVTAQFNPSSSSVVPVTIKPEWEGTLVGEWVDTVTPATVRVSDSAPIGDHTITLIQRPSGFTVCVQLTIVQQQTEALKKSQAEELLTRIQDAEQMLPSCNLTPVERAEANSTLTKATDELKINGDVQAAKALFDGVRELLLNCPDVALPITTQTTIVTIATQTTVVPASQVSLGFVLFFFVMALVSYKIAVAWRSGRRNKAAL